MSSYKNHISSSHVTAAASRIAAHIHKTPVMTSSKLDAAAGRKLYFKCEHLQKTGSFKARGAVNAMLQLHDSVQGVVTHSSGNHGQAVAWAAQKLQLQCCVVVPQGTPSTKTDAIVGYGAELVTCEPNLADRKLQCERISRETGFTVIPSSDHYHVMAGQATIASEFLQQVPQLDAILATISGGGMTSGIAVAAKSAKQDVKVFCVEPEGKQLADSLAAGKRLWTNSDSFLPTMAEAIRIRPAGELTFPVLCDLAEKQVLTVTDQQMVEGMQLSARFLKQSVEAAAGAAVYAAVHSQLPQHVQHVGVVLCGGNVELSDLVKYFSK